MEQNNDIKQLKDTYPGNSKKEQANIEDKKVEKVITGTGIRKKKSLARKMADTFVGEDVDNVLQYLMFDVLVPAAKSTVSEMVSSGIEMLLFGDTKGSRTKRDRGRSYVTYDSSTIRDKNSHISNRSGRNMARHNFDDIILSSRGEAEDVLSHLLTLIADFGVASVADYYDLVDITSNFTDTKYGWTTLSRATVDRVRQGYMINLPKTSVID